MRSVIFPHRDGVVDRNRADHVTRWEDVAPVWGSLSSLRSLTSQRLALRDVQRI